MGYDAFGERCNMCGDYQCQNKLCDEKRAHVAAHPCKVTVTMVKAGHETLTLSDIEERLIKAWRKSGVSLGRLLTSATDDHALCGADSMHALTDTGLVGMVEHWAEQRARNAAAKGGE